MSCQRESPIFDLNLVSEPTNSGWLAKLLLEQEQSRLKAEQSIKQEALLL